MGMVVRTNMAALNANNSLQNASKAQQTGMQKLASGFKINKAADDASGLSISEKMKAQIKALDTAKDNCEDGANLIQTAEGYMNETHDMLNRMVELSEKAANGVLEDTDRDALQDEMNQLCGEIDRMATTANFNGRKLLDGSIGSSAKVKITSDAVTGKNGYEVEIGEETKRIYTEKASTLAGKKVGTSTAGTAAAIKDIASKDFNMSDASEIAALTKKINDAVNKTASEDEDATKAFAALEEDVAAKEKDLADAQKALLEDPTDADLVKAVTTAATALASATKALETGNSDSNTANSNVNDGDAIESDVFIYVNKKGDIYTTLDDKDDKAKELEKNVYNQPGAAGTVTNEDGYLKYKVTVSHTSEKGSVDDKEGIKLQIGETSTAADKMEVKIGSFHTDTLLGGIDGFQNLTAESTNETDAKATAATMKNDTATYKDGITIDIGDQNKASAAADALRQVSNYVSDQRGKLGAQQNRLDHTVNNLSTASENVTAANSRIRDTDMAKEMMAYTSKNVIAQAAQSMLAQANSQPQNVLSLLQ